SRSAISTRICCAPLRERGTTGGDIRQPSVQIFQMARNSQRVKKNKCSLGNCNEILYFPRLIAGRTLILALKGVKRKIQTLYGPRDPIPGTGFSVSARREARSTRTSSPQEKPL